MRQHIQFLVDNSVSMHEHREAYQKEVNAVLQGLTRRDSRTVGLATFGQKLTWHYQSKPVVEAAQDQILIEPKGTTALYDCFAQCVDDTLAWWQRQTETITVYFYLFTDGLETSSFKNDLDKFNAKWDWAWGQGLILSMFFCDQNRVMTDITNLHALSASARSGMEKRLIVPQF